MDMTTISFGVGMFTAVVLVLVFIILAARSALVSTGDVSIEINGEKTITVPAGGKLLQTLSEADLFLPSACGGGGTCAQCKCIISEGGGSMLPTEESHFTRRDAEEGWRLYTGPIAASDGSHVDARAVRYGFEASSTVTGP